MTRVYPPRSHTQHRFWPCLTGRQGLRHDGVVLFPTKWTFVLDERATHMSLASTAGDAGPAFATPETVDLAVASFPRTAATPPDVVALLDLAHKLLRTSVVHYEFAALAVEKSIQA